MKIVILAGGQGKRMWPIATDKCLIPFLGKPLLYHNLKQIKENIKDGEFIFVANPQSQDEVEKVTKELKLAYTVAIQREPKVRLDLPGRNDVESRSQRALVLPSKEVRV